MPNSARRSTWANERRLIDLDRLLTEVDDRRGEMIDLCGALVGAASPNPPGDARAAADVLKDFLTSHGQQFEVRSRDESMPNIVSRCHAGRAGRMVVLNVHLDTMPQGDAAAWSVPPYRMSRRDGRLYGLGIGNMKGAVAGMAVAYTVLTRHRELWPGELVFTAVSDECVFGDAGAAYLLNDDPALKGDALISGEGPGGMRLGVAEKGVAWYRLESAAGGGHATSVVGGGSAIARLAGAIVDIDQMNGRRGALPMELSALEGVDDPGLALSVNAGTIHGGEYISQVATHASTELDCRLPPGVTVSDMDRLIQEAIGEAQVTWRRLKGWDANWTPVANELVESFRIAIEAIRSRPVSYAIRLPASDASRWRTLGVPAVCYGPQRGFSAGVDDNVLEQDVLDAAKVYVMGALKYLTGARS
jgi:succinyl-diaminopimelate desuccinylase